MLEIYLLFPHKNGIKGILFDKLNLTASLIPVARFPQAVKIENQKDLHYLIKMQKQTPPKREEPLVAKVDYNLIPEELQIKDNSLYIV